MPKIEYLVDVYVADDNIEDYPTHARIVLTDKLIKRIFQLRKIVRDTKIFVIEDLDNTPCLLVENDDGEKVEWEGRIDVMRLGVFEEDFRWHFYIQDSYGHTATITHGELRENLKILRAKEYNLPRLAVSILKFESSKLLVEKRLKGE